MSRSRKPAPVSAELFKCEEAEKAVLGSMLCSDLIAQDVVAQLTHEDFGPDVHRRIYKAMSGLVLAGKKILRPILLQHIEPSHSEDDEAADPATYLAALQEEAVEPSLAVDYADTIKATAARRKMLETARALEQKAAEIPAGTSADAIMSAMSDMIERQADTDDGDIMTFGEVVDRALQEAEHNRSMDGAVVGVATGLKDLDDELGGLHPTDLVILAGRPGMGKSALAVNIATDAARRGEAVGIFSLEMSASQLAVREISAAAGVVGNKVRRGTLNDAEFDAFKERAEEMRALPIYIDQTGGISLGMLAMKARKMKKKFGIKLLVIDYLQLMKGPSRSSRGDFNRVQELGDITAGLKALAKELLIPVVALSQLSRKVDEREPPRPILSDLRESGSIEQDADIVMFVYREEYYLKFKRPQEGGHAAIEEWKDRMAGCKGVAEVIIGKQRHGAAVNVLCSFDAEQTKFKNYVEPTKRERTKDNTFAFKLDTHKAIFDALVQVRKAKGEPPTLELEKKVPKGQPVINVRAWREELRARSPAREGDTNEARADRVHKAVQRFIDTYGQSGVRLIGFRDEMVWLTGKAVKGFDTGVPGRLSDILPDMSMSDPGPDPDTSTENPDSTWTSDGPDPDTTRTEAPARAVDDAALPF